MRIKFLELYFSPRNSRFFKFYIYIIDIQTFKQTINILNKQKYHQKWLQRKI